MLKILLRIGLNTLIGLVLVFFWLKLVDVEEVVRSLEKVNLLIVMPVIGCFALANIFRAFRLKILLLECGVSLKNLILLNFLSQLLSFVIPVRAGEVSKGVYLSTQYHIPFPKAVIWVFLDRFFDFWLVIFLALILLLIVPNALPQSLILSLGIILIIFTLATAVVIFNQKLFVNLSNRFSELLSLVFLKKIFLKISGLIIETSGLFSNQNTSQLAAGMNGSQKNLPEGILRSKLRSSSLQKQIPRLSLLLVLTLLASVVESIAWYLVLSLFIPVLPILTILLGSMLNALTFLIPAAPGYVGSAEAAGLGVFHFGLMLDKTAVSTATVLIHAITIVYMLLFGLLGLFFLKFNLGLVRDKLFKRD